MIPELAQKFFATLVFGVGTDLSFRAPSTFLAFLHTKTYACHVLPLPDGSETQLIGREGGCHSEFRRVETYSRDPHGYMCNHYKFAVLFQIFLRHLQTFCILLHFISLFVKYLADTCCILPLFLRIHKLMNYLLFLPGGRL